MSSYTQVHKICWYFNPNQIESAYASVFKNFKAFHFTALKIVMTTC
jgi:hypothetical protein